MKMANGLFCADTLSSSETLSSTPKYRHDSNSENTPPEFHPSDLRAYDLLCSESLEDKDLNKSVLDMPLKPLFENFNHPSVKADCDSIILKDDRVLQNLLKNEERYLCSPGDYFQQVQVEIKPHMRKIVSDWMLEVCQELCCQPEVFCLAINLMDRFLAICRISKGQLQLLGAACLFLSSKFKALDHISSDKLVMYTDYSVSHHELKDWELLVLHKLRWELSSTTPLDFLDHILPRLCLPAHIDLQRLRMKTETIIALAATHGRFSGQLPSLLAAASILTALRSCNLETRDRSLEALLRVTKMASPASGGDTPTGLSDKVLRETRLCLQILTHAGAEKLELCCRDLGECLPHYLTGYQPAVPSSPDTTQSSAHQAYREGEEPLLSSLEIFTDLSHSVLFNQKPDQSFSATAEHVSNSILVT